MNAWEIKREASIPMWQERIRECRSSGMTVKAWCKQNGLTKQTYYAWEKLCLQRVSSNQQEATENAIIKVVPEALPTGRSLQKEEVSTAPAELIIHYGCVSMDISPEMPLSRIVDLVAALNNHV